MLSLPDFKEKRVILFFSKEGDRISFTNDNIIIRDRENNVKCQYTCYKLLILFVIGSFNVTSGLIERANRFGFSIIFMTFNLKVYATINSRMEGNTLLREKQYNCDNEQEIAKKIIENKIYNQRNTLTKIREKDEYLKNTIKTLEKYIQHLRKKDVKEIDEIMGIEGVAAKQYFKQLYKGFNWQGRQPRVKRDEINLLLDIGYTILFNYIEAVANIYGFDIYKGILHREFFKRKSLICDFIEPFRTIIDYKIRRMYTLSQVKSEDFATDDGRYSLGYKNMSKYINYFVEEINKNKEFIFLYIQSFYRWYMKGADINKYPMILLEEK